MQELNKQRKQAKTYITDLVHAALWFSVQFQGTQFDYREPLNIEFDDAYITDRETELESMRADATLRMKRLRIISMRAKSRWTNLKMMKVNCVKQWKQHRQAVSH